MAVTAYVGLGANLGDAAAALDAALAALAALPGTRLAACSPRYRTAPVDATGPDYLNAVAALDTDLSAEALLAALHEIELGHGRERPYRNAPRTLDLDLLLHGEARFDLPHLVVPHPRLHERAFVLVPLADLAPHLVVPGRGRVRDLLDGVADQRIERTLP
jgi:2-amino-4-hydroxy-6-hydroxymethyldihydropteridine diphosphokinase